MGCPFGCCREDKSPWTGVIVWDCEKVATFEPARGAGGKFGISIHSVEPSMIPCENGEPGMIIDVLSIVKRIDPAGSMEPV